MDIAKKVRQFLSQPNIGHQTFRVPGVGQGFNNVPQQRPIQQKSFANNLAQKAIIEGFKFYNNTKLPVNTYVPNVPALGLIKATPKQFSNTAAGLVRPFTRTVGGLEQDAVNRFLLNPRGASVDQVQFQHPITKFVFGSEPIKPLVPQVRGYLEKPYVKNPITGETKYSKTKLSKGQAAAVAPLAALGIGVLNYPGNPTSLGKTGGVQGVKALARESKDVGEFMAVLKNNKPLLQEAIGIIKDTKNTYGSLEDIFRGYRFGEGLNKAKLAKKNEQFVKELQIERGLNNNLGAKLNADLPSFQELTTPEGIKKLIRIAKDESGAINLGAKVSLKKSQVPDVSQAKLSSEAIIPQSVPEAGLYDVKPKVYQLFNPEGKLRGETIMPPSAEWQAMVQKGYTIREAGAPVAESVTPKVRPIDIAREKRNANLLAKKSPQIDEWLNQGYKPEATQIKDQKALAELEKEYAHLRKVAPLGNKNHPDSIRLLEVKQQLENPPTKTVYRMWEPNGIYGESISKSEYEYALSKQSRVAQPMSKAQDSLRSQPSQTAGLYDAGKYYIRNGLNELVKAENAKPVNLGDGIDAFSHTFGKGTGVVISEAKTGMQIAKGKTEKEAIANAQKAFRELRGITPQQLIERQLKSLERGIIKGTDGGIGRRIVGDLNTDKEAIPYKEVNRFGSRRIMQGANPSSVNNSRLSQARAELDQLRGDGALPLGGSKSRVAQQPLSDAKPLSMKGNVAAQIDKEINGGASLAPAKQQSAQLKQSQNLQPTAPDLPPTAPPGGGNTSSLDNIIPQGQKQKGFLENIQTGNTSNELKAATGQLDQGYTPITNQESLAKAQETVSKTPNIAKEYVMSKEPPTAEKMATADLLIKKYEAENNIDEAIEVVNSMDRQLREAGQFVQAASIWNKLSPASLTRVAKKAYSNVGKELDAETEKIIYDKALGIQKITNPEQRNTEILNLLNYVAEKLPPTRGEIFEAYRYQNMLSSPKTQLRNIYSNLLNTLITRPINLGLEATYDIMRHPFNPLARDVALSDVPLYYKGVFTSVPNSIMAAKEAMKSGSSALKLDLGKGETTIDVLRKQNIPLKYSAVPRFMEGQDRFFSTLIASGEKSRLIRNGLDEITANAQATELAQKYLYRNQLGKDAKDLPIFARALDSLGKFALEGRKLPIVGKPYSWFVPFVTTPINAAKVMIEHSPAGFIGGKYTNEQLAKATAGSIVVGVGGMLAMQDKTTWAAPTDKKQKELWYATGRKPYSIQVGDKWVPMWYFGPYALALGIPAALKYNYQDSKTAMSDGDLQKITKTVGELSKFVVNQTPLSGVGSFFQMLDGDADITAGNLAGFTLGQVILAQGFIRWVNTIIDPTYRQARGFTETIMKDMPILSKQLKPYTLPNGEESKRLGINSFIPYDVGQVNNEYEPALQGRTAQLQTNAVKNKTIKEAKEQAGGQSTTIDNTIIANDGSTIDLTPPTTGNGIDAFTNENWNYTKARDVWKAKTSGLIDESTASEAYSKLGVDEGDVRYDYIATKSNDIKTQYIMSKNLNHDELINRLVTGRVVSATGRQFASDGVINNLRDEGLITDYEAKALKKLKVDKAGKPVGGAGRKSGRVRTAKAPKFGKAPTVKIKLGKANKKRLGSVRLGKAKTSKTRVKGYDSYESDLKKIARSTGAKV